MTNILHLPIKQKWFDLIAEGKKTIEYREIKPHWISRLFEQPMIKPFRIKHFDEVHFRAGYSSDVPFMRVEYNGLVMEKWQGEKHFGILLGKVLEVKNVK